MKGRSRRVESRTVFVAVFLDDAITNVEDEVVGDGDGATYLDESHLIFGVADGESSSCIGSNVPQLLFAGGGREEDVVTIEQKPHRGALRAAVGEQRGEDPSVRAAKYREEVFAGRRRDAHAYHPNQAIGLVVQTPITLSEIE